MQNNFQKIYLLNPGLVKTNTKLKRQVAYSQNNLIIYIYNIYCQLKPQGIYKMKDLTKLFLNLLLFFFSISLAKQEINISNLF